MSITKKKELDLFVEKCLPEIDNYISFNIPSSIKANAQEITQSHLNLPTMGQVRDRFEGQKYYDRIYRKLIVFYCLEKMVGKPIISKFIIKANKSANLNHTHIKGKYVAIVDFLFGELPLIDTNFSSSTLIFCLKEGYKQAYFCGSLSKKELDIKSNFIINKSISKKHHASLIAFNKLEKLF
jgi:hypothetical protein